MQIGDVVPEWDVTGWVGGDASTLREQRGRVIVVHTFQMLCPGCIYRGIPQAIELSRRVDPADVSVIGLHTVFEHHEAMTEGNLRVFLSELRVPFPVGIDRHDAQLQTPATMRAWGLRGTPSTVVIDREGRLAHAGFGTEDDMSLALRVGRLLEPASGCAADLCVASEPRMMGEHQ